MKNKILKLRLYRDKQKQFRWTLIASNGKKLADSGEGYHHRSAMKKALALLLLGPSMDFYDMEDCRNDIILDDDTNGKARR
jgi:uncharacterized protein YegP (UPF0339 family)